MSDTKLFIKVFGSAIAYLAATAILGLLLGDFAAGVWVGLFFVFVAVFCGLITMMIQDFREERSARMSDWKQPQPPLLSHLFVEDLIKANEERGRKPQAFDTPFRYSDAGKCARAMAYSALGFEGEPFDGPSTFVTTLGTEIHEWVQDAILARYPDAKFEIPTQLGVSSGHCDGVIETEEYGRVLYELKTMGGTPYGKSIGAGAKGMNTPGGPRYSAVLQAAINAEANECDTVIIGHIGLEAISRQKAGRLDLNDWMRFISEWVIPKEVWQPLAMQEINRQLYILDDLQAGRLPLRIAINDAGLEENLDPELGRAWQCWYCSHQERCLSDGGGTPEVRN
jgi:hypothetical protein